MLFMQKKRQKNIAFGDKDNKKVSFTNTWELFLCICYKT